jgi:nitric oxide reductase large subunit
VVRVQREIHTNGWDEAAGVIRINDAQIYAHRELLKHYTRMFTDRTYSEAFTLENYITDPENLQTLTAFFF